MRWLRQLIRSRPIWITAYCSECKQQQTAQMRTGVNDGAIAFCIFCRNWLGNVKEHPSC